MAWLGLSGMSFAVALTSLGAAIVALYLLREQRRRSIVPALALWESLLKSRAQAALANRLRRILSLLLALSILTCLLLGLADIRQRYLQTGRSLVLLVDRSASMNATDVLPTRLDRAKRAGAELIASLNPSDQALIVALDQQATPLSTWTHDKAALKITLDAISDSDMTSDLSRGMSLALDALAARSHPEIYLLSDGNVAHEAVAQNALASHPNVGFHHVRVGASARNVGITGFSVRSYPLDRGHLEGVLSMANFGTTREEVRLLVHAVDTPLFEESLTLEPGQQVSRTLPDLPRHEAPLEASLVLARGADDLRRDDRAFAVLPKARRTRVLLVSEGNRYLEAALLLDEYLDVRESTPKAYRSAEGFDVVVFDRVRPTSDPGVPALYLGVSDTPGYFPLATQGSLTRPFLDRLAPGHPLVHQLALRDINLARATVLVPDASDLVIASTDARVPLIVEGTRKAPFLALAFDVRESDFPLRPAWPLFVLRSLERLHAQNDSPSSSVPSGSIVHVALPEGTSEATLMGPFGTQRRLQAHQDQVSFRADHAGLYRVVQGELESQIAVRLDTHAEGQIAPRDTLLGQGRALPPKRSLSGWPEHTWPWFVGLALAVLCVEWLTFHRRWTV